VSHFLFLFLNTDVTISYGILLPQTAPVHLFNCLEVFLICPCPTVVFEQYLAENVFVCMVIVHWPPSPADIHETPSPSFALPLPLPLCPCLSNGDPRVSPLGKFWNQKSVLDININTFIYQVFTVTREFH